MNQVYKYKPTDLKEETLKTLAIAAFYVARREELFNSFGNRLKVLAVYADGSVSPTQLINVVKSVREDDKEVDLFHVTTSDGKREFPVVVI